VPADEHDALLARYSDLQDRFRLHDGYAIDLKVASVLRGLGFQTDDAQRPVETFSGGWQMRIALAKLLLGQPDLLLLDEPTNHLDLDARNWLEAYLNAYPHAVILVSHDRYFLDAVVTRIADLSLRTLTDYYGGYSDYLVERDARLERLREAKRRQDEEVTRVRQFIDRFRYQATKASQVQSRIKMLEKVVPIEVPPERKRIHFHFPAAPKSGRSVLELRHVDKAYGSTVVFRDLTLQVARGDRLALVGPNGAGKSTLMRMLADAEPPDAGERIEGHQLVMQYFAQDEATRLNPDLTVYETLAAGSPMDMVPAIRNILGGFLFSGDDIYKRAAVLSGGERTRLAVARMLLHPSNTLLLDEPTNHLDLDSKDVLLDALEDYGGTMIFVSHDRYFVERLATKVVEVGGGTATVYPGRYEEFLWSKAQKTDGQLTPPRAGHVAVAADGHDRLQPRRAEDERIRGEASAKARGGGGAPPPVKDVDGKLDREARKQQQADQRRRDRETRARRARIDDLEARIGEREAAIKELEAAMTAPGFYADREAAQPIIDRHQALMWEVGSLMEQWESLQELLTTDES